MLNNKTKNTNILEKPFWIKIKFPYDVSKIKKIKKKLRKNNLFTVCEEAACPNLTECFSKGTATFMILGSICTRNCSFCNVTNGRPAILNELEPIKLAKIISKMKLKYVVVTSVNRDDLHDGGADHFSKCIQLIRIHNPKIIIEVLVPDFRNCIDIALKKISKFPPNVFNHNLENVPRLYKIVRPGANYQNSLSLLKKFKKINPNIPTKSGLMVGLGETNDEIINVMKDLRKNKVNMLTIGQYLRPSLKNYPVQRYVDQNEFDKIKKEAIKMGFTHVACGPLVRSSYHADLQLKNKL